MTARHRAPAGEPLGSRRYQPKHAAGEWHPARDESPEPTWPGGRRPELRDNLPKETPR